MKSDEFILERFSDNAFDLRDHLIDFLQVSNSELEKFLNNAKIELANLHPGDELQDSSDFYKEIVGDKHLADLAAWHISSKNYISDTIKLQQRFAGKLILDFGGGIGTHALANAMSEKVEHVFFVDINQTNKDFVSYRAKKLGLEKKISFYKSIKETNILEFNTIVCFDVLEHLPDPASQLLEFHKVMGPKSVALFNWYFYKGDNNEYPFHIDDAIVVENFFEVLQKNFLEVFHPILITSRSYIKN